MATLKELTLSGIRNFNPNEEKFQKIEFTSPLTLILGQNGCGKTTIIESIKYACTQKLPEGSANNNKVFVFNPQLCENNTTVGRINLTINDPRNGEINVRRVVEFGKKSEKSNLSAIGDDFCEGSAATKKCCEILKLSEPILNYVIFCHQEDSSWPMSSGQILKQRFDEIFALEMYDACVDKLREHLEELKEKKLANLHQRYEIAETKKKYVEERTLELGKYQQKLLSAEENIKGLRKKLKIVDKETEEIDKIENVLHQLVVRIDGFKGIKEELVDLEKNVLFPFTGTDEELRNVIERIKEDVGGTGLVSKLEEENAKIEDLCEKNTQAVQETKISLEKLRVQQVEFQKKLSKQVNLIKSVENEARISQTNWDFDREGLKLVVGRIRDILGVKQEQLEKFTNIKVTELAQIQEKMAEIKEQKIRMEQFVKSKKEQLELCEEGLAKATKDADNFLTSDDDLTKCNTNLQNVIEDIKNLEATFKEDEENRIVASLADQIITAKNDLNICVNIESERCLIQEKEEEIKNIKEEQEENFKHLFGESVPEENLEELLLNKQKRAIDVVKTLKEEITKKENEVATLKAHCKLEKHNIESSEDELKNKRNEILQVCNGRNFDETLENTLSKKKQLQIQKEHYNSVKSVYRQFIKNFEADDSPCCPVCESDFRYKSDLVNKIVTKLKKKMEDVPVDVAKVEEELEEQETLFNTLQQLTMVNKKVKQIAEELPPAKISLTKFEENLKHDVEELKKLKNQLDMYEYMVQICYKGNLLAEKQIRLKEKVQIRRKLKVEVAKYSSKITLLRKEMSELEGTISVLETNLKTFSEEKRKVAIENNDKIQTEKEKVNSFEKIVTQMEVLQREIDHYWNSNMCETITSTEVDLKKYEEEEISLKSMKIKTLNELEAARTDLAKLPTLQNHIRLRKKKSDEMKLSNIIRNLNEQIGTYDDASVSQKKQELKEKSPTLRGEIQVLKTRGNELMQWIEDLQKELAQPENVNALNNYKKELYKLKIMESLIEELPKYINLLENAVVEYHRQKLDEINITIRELWGQIYKGNDIDYIQINAESVTPSGKRRTYSYKVVQIKNDVEIDMRFCCSTGQRFLACLIIRMALAERLCSNCGILSLDAPTTNLDRENIQSLCDMLCQIIRVKQEKNENFQLVVITHDEEFFNTLRKAHGSSLYHRVKRDREGYSIIEPETL